MFVLWLKFVVCAAVVIFCGYRICIYAEKITQITKISRTFIGLILLSVVTSLPELAVAFSATKIGALDLAMGDLFGSNLFNLTIVGIVLLAFIKKPERLSLDTSHFMSASFSVLLITFAAMGIICYKLFFPYVDYSPILLNVETVLILITYIFAAYLIFRSEIGKTAPSSKRSVGQGVLAKIWLKFLIYAIFLVGFAMYLSQLGDRIARIPIGGVALGGTFVGSLFLAVITSLPEASVAISAVKIGSLDMGLANIFGSNMFNMAIIPVADLCLGRKVILSSVSTLHLFTILFVIISTVIIMSGLAYRSKRKTPALAWDSAAIIFIYFAANLVNFYLR